MSLVAPSTRSRILRWTAATLLAPLCVFLAAARVAAQDAQENEFGGTLSTRAAAGVEPRVTLVLEGFVLLPDGAPAEGAVVVSSAGGKAVTNVAGTTG